MNWNASALKNICEEVLFEFAQERGHMMSKGRFRRRKSASLITLLAAVVLLITGTLAWQAISQRALNNVAGEILPAGARLHDDFSLGDEPDFKQPLNKDVYVENYSGQNPLDASDMGEPVFVRVKLTEYMETGVGAGLFAVSGNDPGDYQTLDRVDADGTRIEDPANDADSLIPTASILDLSTWRTHIEDEPANPFAAYWTWTMGGTKAFMPTFNKDNTSLLTDRIQYDKDQFIAGIDKESGTALYANPLYDNTSEEHTAKDTLATAGIVSMAEWIGLNRPLDNNGNGYWVGDADGWYYWSKPLDVGDATALLLDQITVTGPVEGEFYYGIHVIAEMATAGDWGDADAQTGFYKDGITADGLVLLNQAAGLIPIIEDVTIEGGSVILVKSGDTKIFQADVSINNPTDDASETAVTWELTPAHSGFTNGTLVTQSKESPGSYTLTATSKALPDAKTATATVVIYPDEGVGVIGPADDGKYYVSYGANVYKEINLTNGTLGAFICAGDDSKIGAGAVGDGEDLTNVVQSPNGKSWFLGQNSDESYYAAGADSMLGTSDDIKVWANPTLDTPVSDQLLVDTYSIILTQVSATGNGADTVMQSRTIDYTATVKKTNTIDGERDAENQNVTWTLEGGPYASGTAVNTTDPTAEAIRLTIGSAETIATGQIKLKATSEVGGATATVNVTVSAYQKTVQEAKKNEEGVDANGVVWLVLDESGDSKLIMTKYVYGFVGDAGPLYNNDIYWSKLDSGTNLKSLLQTFYTNQAGADVRNMAVAYQQPLADIRNTYGSFNPDGEFGNQSSGWSRPGTDKVTENGSNAIFVLSIAEVNNYWPPGGSKLQRLAVDANDKETGRFWWLRSPGASADSSVAGVDANGNIGSATATNPTRGYRPALWVKSTP